MSDVWPKGVPATTEALSKMLRSLRAARRRRKKEQGRPRVRGGLTKKGRELVLSKTDGRCHICGGTVEGKWQADHVLAHSGGGPSSAENYLPAHPLCNSYRWDYLPEELQIILKMGVWTRTQIERETRLGQAIGEAFLKYDRARFGRRRRESSRPSP